MIKKFRKIYHSTVWQKPSKMVKFNLIGMLVLVTTVDLDVRIGWYKGDHEWMTYNMKKWAIEKKNVIAWKYLRPYKTKKIEEIVRRVQVKENEQNNFNG